MLNTMPPLASVRIVIIGAGMAGSKLANDLLEKHGKGQDITLIGEEAQVGYNRIMLSSLLANDISEKDMSLVDIDKMQNEGIRIIAGDPAVSINLESKVVLLASGQDITYDKLILATGSRARILPIKGAFAPNVMGFRTWQDVNQLSSY